MSIALIVLSFILWLVGGNLLTAMHHRRRGLPIWSGLKPFAFPIKHFVWFEWVALAVLLVVSLILLGIGIGLIENAQRAT